MSLQSWASDFRSVLSTSVYENAISMTNLGPKIPRSPQNWQGLDTYMPADANVTDYKVARLLSTVTINGNAEPCIILDFNMRHWNDAFTANLLNLHFVPETPGQFERLKSVEAFGLTIAGWVLTNPHVLLIRDLGTQKMALKLEVQAQNHPEASINGKVAGAYWCWEGK